MGVPVSLLTNAFSPGSEDIFEEFHVLKSDLYVSSMHVQYQEF